MTPLQREALQMCLEYIETDAHERRHVRWKINEALAQPQQEPVAWMHEWGDGEKIPMLKGRDDRNQDKPKTVRPLVYGDTSPQPAQQQEPVLMFYEQEWQGKTSRAYQWLIDPFSLPAGTKLYTSPPARKPLTDAQISTIEQNIWNPEFFDEVEIQTNREFARAIEVAHGIKGDA